MPGIEGKTVLIGVSGGIAAYKACELISRLKKAGAIVHVVMTQNATQFVTPLTFETLSQNRAVTDTFDRNFSYDVGHVSLAKKADLFVVIPATANVIAKLNHGIADDMLTTTALALSCPVVVCPAMNTGMYNNPKYRKNQQELEQSGYIFVKPASGRLACGDIGEGKLAPVEDIYQKILDVLTKKQDYAGKRVLITAGATWENIDGVRYITNRSSGKMGAALAEAAQSRGGAVTVVCGKMTAQLPAKVQRVDVSTTLEMYDEVLNRFKDFDILIKAAAPSDYRIKQAAKQKLKCSEITLHLQKNPDIAAAVGAIKDGRKLVVFCAETEELIKNALKKIVDKNADLIVANDITKEGAGFDSDTNIAAIIDRANNIYEYPKMPKRELADIILDRILSL